MCCLRCHFGGFLQASVRKSPLSICVNTVYLLTFVARLLLELLEFLFEKFNAVAAAHSAVLGYLQDTVVTPLAQQEDVKLYDMADVWVKIQDVLQVRPFYGVFCLRSGQQGGAIARSSAAWSIPSQPGRESWSCLKVMLLSSWTSVILRRTVNKLPSQTLKWEGGAQCLAIRDVQCLAFGCRVLYSPGISPVARKSISKCS